MLIIRGQFNIPAWEKAWRQKFLLHIVSDYEGLSSFLVCRYLLKQFHIHCFPIQSTPYLFCSKVTGNVIQKAEAALGLRISDESYLLEQEDSVFYQAFSPQQALLFYYFHWCLENHFLAFRDCHSGQSQIIPNINHHESIVKTPVIMIANCTIDSNGSTILYLEPSFRKLVFPTSHIEEGFLQSESYVSLLTGEEIQLSMTDISNDDFIDPRMLKETMTGIMQYLPNSQERFVTYWTLAMGPSVTIQSSAILTILESGGIIRKVPSNTIVRNIIDLSSNHPSFLSQLEPMKQQLSQIATTVPFFSLEESTTLQELQHQNPFSQRFQKASTTFKKERDELDDLFEEEEPLVVFPQKRQRRN